MFAATLKEEVKKDVGLNFTGFISTFKSAMGEYAEKCYAAAKTLFYLLFLCQFVWAIIQLCLQESLSFATVVATIVRQIMAGGFFYWFLLDRTILDSIVKSFSALTGKSGGHNGLRSIGWALGTRDYARLRVGIGRPPGRQDPADFVLSDFPARERGELGVTLEQAADAVEAVVELGFEAAQQRLHSA